MLTRYVLPVVALALAAFAVSRMLVAQTPPPETVPPVEPARSIYARQLAGAGLVEPASENISIGTHLPGVVDRVFVRVGTQVRTGDPLFQLDPRQLSAEVAAREAARASAEAEQAKLDAGARPEEIPPAEAKVNEAAAAVREQESLFDRYKRLAQSSTVTGEELVRREVALEMARAQLAKAKADLQLLVAGAWQFDRAIATAGVRLAEAQLATTRSDLDRLTVRAPRGRQDTPDASETVTFEVLQVNVRPGEFVATTAGTPLVLLGRQGALHVRVDVDENDIGRFRPGLKGLATPRGNPDRNYQIRFVRVEPYVIPKKSLTGGSLERVDTRVLQVIYAIDPGGPALYVGQQMDVFLDATD